MRIVIFGANGQDGRYLNELLGPLNYEVINISRKDSMVIGDISDYLFVESIIKKYQPEFAFHFAANSTTRHSAMFENNASIGTGTLNLLESVRLHSPTTKVFLSGSAMQFKNEGKAINEFAEFDASSPYSVSRIQSVYAGRYYRDKFMLKVYTGYFFNHDSPYRTEHHVNQKIAKAVNRIADGDPEKLVIGNIEVRKEFNYAGDVVKAIWRLVNQDVIFEAIIGNGEAHSILEWLDYCFSQKKLYWRDHVVLESNFIPEYDLLVSDPTLIKSLGWQPSVDFYQLANLMLNAK